MRKALVLGSVALAVAGTAFAAAPASADTASTTVTFSTASTSLLTILPAAAAAGTTSGSTVTATFATVVTDTRTAAGNWTDVVSSSAYNLVGASSPTGTATVPASSAKIWTGTAVVTVPGTATTNLQGHIDAASALALTGTAQTLTTAATTNANIVTLNQNLQIDVTGKAVGAYTGTLTQTVS